MSKAENRQPTNESEYDSDDSAIQKKKKAAEEKLPKGPEIPK